MAVTDLKRLLAAHLTRVWRVLLPLSICTAFVLLVQAFTYLHWPIWAFVLVGVPLSFITGFVFGLFATLVVTLWIDRKKLGL